MVVGDRVTEDVCEEVTEHESVRLVDIVDESEPLQEDDIVSDNDDDSVGVVVTVDVSESDEVTDVDSVHVIERVSEYDGVLESDPVSVMLAEDVVDKDVDSDGVNDTELLKEDVAVALALGDRDTVKESEIESDMDSEVDNETDAVFVPERVGVDDIVMVDVNESDEDIEALRE